MNKLVLLLILIPTLLTAQVQISQPYNFLQYVKIQKYLQIGDTVSADSIRVGNKWLSNKTNFGVLGFTPENVAHKNQANGYAGLNGSGLISTSQLPSLVISNTYVDTNQTAMLTGTRNIGDISVRTDSTETFILKSTPSSSRANWVLLQTPSNAPVQSVNTRVGNIVLDQTDVGIPAFSNTKFLKSGTSAMTWNNISITDITGLTDTLSTKIRFNNLSAASPLNYNSSGAFTINQASGSTNGYLSSADWTIFNTKQSQLSGTGFVKASGSSISYDNSTYLTTSGTAANSALLQGRDSIYIKANWKSNLIDGIFHFDGSSFNPYTTSIPGKFDNSTTIPTNTSNTLNWNGVFYGSQLYAGHIEGTTTVGIAIAGGATTTGFGVLGATSSGIGIYGSANSGIAGYFNSASGIGIKINHSSGNSSDLLLGQINLVTKFRVDYLGNAYKANTDTFAFLSNIRSKFTLPSLTPGSVLFSDGTTIAQNNANLFWNNSTTRLGLLTNSPSYDLSFGSNTLSTRTIGVERGTASAAKGPDLTIRAGATKSGNTDQSGGMVVAQSGVGTGAAIYTAFAVSSYSPRASGNIDQSSAYLLNIANNGNMSLNSGIVPGLINFSVGRESACVMGMDRSIMAGHEGSNLTLRAGGAQTTASNKSGGTLIFSDGISTGNTTRTSFQWLTGDSTSSGTTDQTATAKMTMLSKGWLGIGTTTPNYLLDVNGDINISTGSHFKINGTNISAGSLNAFIYNDTTGGSGLNKVVTPYYQATHNISGSGTVTNVSIVSANHITGTVATASTTPAITLSPDSTYWGTVYKNSLKQNSADTVNAVRSGVASKFDYLYWNSKQNALNGGFGFVKSESGAISYDNSTYLTISDTTKLHNQIALKLNISDTTKLHNQIILKQNRADTVNTTSSGIASKFDYNLWNNKFTLPSLTSGSLLFYNGTTLSQDNANLFWDNTNKRLGIGTATPAEPLEISTNGASVILNLTAGNINTITPVFRFSSSRGNVTSPTQIVSGDALGMFGFAGYGLTNYGPMVAGIRAFASQTFTDVAKGTYFTFEAAPTNSATRSEIMRITGDGKIGINTTNAQNALDINGSLAVGSYAGVNAAPSNSIIVSAKIGVGTTSPTNILSLSGQSAQIIWMERNVTSNTAGNGLTIKTGGATGGSSNKGGAGLILQGDISTGTRGTTKIELDRTSRNATSSTTDNTFMPHFTIPSTKPLTNNQADTLYSVVINSDSTYTATLSMGITCNNGTDRQTISGFYQIAASIKLGSIAGYSFVSNSTESTHLTTGTLTETLSLNYKVSTKVLYILANYNSSLSPTAGQMKASFTILQQSGTSGSITQY